MDTFEPDYTHVESEKSIWGCLAIGCVSVISLGVIAMVTTGFAFYYFVDGKINQYTSAEQVDIPASTYSDEEKTAVSERTKKFTQALSKNEAADVLILTEGDLNALLDMEGSKIPNVYVDIQEGKVSAQVSIPIESLELPVGIGKDRYFNGSADVSFDVVEGQLVCYIIEVQANGEIIENEIVDELKGKNILEEIKGDGIPKIIRRLKSVEIKDETIILTPLPPFEDAESDQEPVSDAADSGQDPESEQKATEDEDAPTKSN
jgi:hypothetical protein